MIPSEKRLEMAFSPFGNPDMITGDWAEQHYARVRDEIRKFVKRHFKVTLEGDFDEFVPPGHPLISISPCHRFGNPRVKSCGNSTNVLYRLWLAEDKDFKSVAEWHEITEDEVRAAVAFHEAFPKMLCKRGWRK